MTNDTRLLCGWVEGRICHLPPGHEGDHWTVQGDTSDALEAEVRRLRDENDGLALSLRAVAAMATEAAA